MPLTNNGISLVMDQLRTTLHTLNRTQFGLGVSICRGALNTVKIAVGGSKREEIGFEVFGLVDSTPRALVRVTEKGNKKADQLPIIYKIGSLGHIYLLPV